MSELRQITVCRKPVKCGLLFLVLCYFTTYQLAFYFLLDYTFILLDYKFIALVLI